MQCTDATMSIVNLVEVLLVKDYRGLVYESDRFVNIYRYTNSKIICSRTYLERRKSLAPKRQIEHMVSDKELSI